VIVDAAKVRKQIDPAAACGLHLELRVALFQREAPRMQRDDHRNRRTARIVVGWNNDVGRLKRFIARAA
jgi:hypothetical protein